MPYIVHTTCSNFRWHEASPEAAIKRAQATAKLRKSTVNLFSEIDGKVGPMLAAFNERGEPFT